MTDILVVDDLPEICDLVAEILRWEGFSVETALEGAAARALLARRPFDLALIDAVLPGETGVSLAQHAASLGVRVIVVSGNRAALAMLADLPWPVVAKPFRVGQLVATVREALAAPQ